MKILELLVDDPVEIDPSIILLHSFIAWNQRHDRMFAERARRAQGCEATANPLIIVCTMDDALRPERFARRS
jgi:hypothetical protein